MMSKKLPLVIAFLLIPTLLLCQHRTTRQSSSFTGKTPRETMTMTETNRGMRRGLIEELGITDTQLDKMESIGLEEAKATSEMRTHLKLLNMELKSMWLATNLDEAEIMKRVREKEQIRSQLAEKRAEYKLKRMNILTAAQRQLLKRRQLRKNMRHFMGNR